MRLTHKLLPLFLTSFAGITAGCVELDLPVFPEYGEDCTDAQYFQNSRGDRIFKKSVKCESDQCTDEEIIIKSLNENKCPKYTFCFYDNSNTPFCAANCPKDQHIYTSEDIKFCIDDTDPLHCGENNINCLEINDGWEKALCEIVRGEPKCRLESCKIGWRQDQTIPDTCVNAQNCCGAFCSSCQLEDQLCYSQTQDFEFDTKAACVENCDDVNDPADENHDFIACHGACIDRGSNDFCGTFSTCESIKCADPKTCLPTGRTIEDNTNEDSSPVKRREFKCLCEPKDGEEAVTFCTDRQECVSLTDTNHCGRCGNVCILQSDTWEEVGCRKIHQEKPIKCIDDDCDLTDELKCSPTKCKPGYSLAEIDNKIICKEDLVINCGPTSLNCDNALNNTAETACESGKCIAKKCKDGYIVNDNQCIPHICTANSWICDGTSRKQCNELGSDYKDAIACPVPSNGSAVCTNGNCGISCSSGYYINGSTCTKQVCSPNSWTCTGTSRKQCNANGSDYNTPVACPVPANGSATCTGSTCGISCNSGYTLCSSACVNTKTSKDHCGKCGNVCNTSAVANSTAVSCTGGTCNAASCANGYHVYNGKCEIDSNTNCGAHGKACNITGASCKSGSCECKISSQHPNISTNICIAAVCEGFYGATAGEAFGTASCVVTQCTSAFVMDNNIDEHWGTCRPKGTSTAVCNTLPGWSTSTISGSQCWADSCKAGYNKYHRTCQPKDYCCGQTCKNCKMQGKTCSSDQSGSCQ